MSPRSSMSGARRLWRLRWVASILAVLIGATASSLPAATADTITLTLTVAETTALATDCAAGGPAANLGVTLAGSRARTQADCEVVFGSGSADTELRIFQADGGGNALMPTPKADVVGSWSFNGDWRDTSPSGADATPGAGAQQPSFVAGTGPRGSAAAFDGNDVATVAHDAAFALGAFTVEAWIDVSSIANDPEPVVARLQDAASDRTFSLHFDRASGMLVGSASFAGVTREVSTPAAPLLGSGWHHLALVAEAGGTLRLHVDGAQVADGTFAGGIDLPVAPIVIGDRLDGSIDELRLHAAARTGAELTSYAVGRIDDYRNDGGAGDRDWSSDPATTGMFGACLREVASGAVTDVDTWAADTVGAADCGDSDADPWQAVPGTSGDAGALVAKAPGGTIDATARLRFGARLPADAPSGSFVAPLIVELVTIAAPPPPPTPPVVASIATNWRDTASSMTVNRPAGTSDGDLLVAIFGYDRSGAASAPAGWSLLRSDQHGTVTTTQRVYWKVAGASEPASYTFNFPSSSYITGGIMRITGADTSAPFDAHGGHGGSTAFLARYMTASSITTTTPGTLLVTAFTVSDGWHQTPPWTAEPAPGMSEVWDVGSFDTWQEVATEQLPVAGATGDRTARSQNTNAFQYVAQMLAIAPA